MLLSKPSLLQLSIFIGGASSSCSQNTSKFNWDKIKHLLVFGDSYSFVQGTHGNPAFSFIGDYLPGNFSFTPEKLLTDAIVGGYSGTAEGGPNWAEDLTGCGGVQNLTYPLQCNTQLWNFAFAGANTAEEFLPLHHNFTVPFVNQTQQWLTWAEPVLKHEIKKQQTLVASWIGINDINDGFKVYPKGKGNLTLYDLWQDIIDTQFTKGLQPLHNAGYRNFLVINLPPLDRTPAAQKSASVRPNTTDVNTWNQYLSARVSQFAQEHKDSKVIFYDVNTFLNHVLDDPVPYGIKNTTSFCPSYINPEVATNPAKFNCQPITEFFWFNSGHMTSTVHKAFTPDLKRLLQSQ